MGTAYARQLSAAQRAYDAAMPPQGDEEFDQLVCDYLADPEKVAEADSWIEGTLDYTGIETVLADLHKIEPTDLLGTDVLTKLYAYAKQAHAARRERIEEMADEYLSDLRDRADDMRFGL